MPPRKQCNAFTFVCVALLCSSVQAIINAGITSNPNTVQEPRAKLTFYGTTENGVKANGGAGYIRLTVPSTIQWHNDAQVTCFDTMTNTSCKVEITPNMYTIKLTADLPASKQFQYEISAAITNPDSVQPSLSFKIDTSDGEQISNGVSLTCEKGKIQSLQLLPQSQVVGDSTTLEVRWRAAHNVPKGGVAILSFPKWNPEQPNASFQKSYIQGKEVCQLISVTPAASISCNFSNDRLIVQAFANNSQLGGIEIAFQVSGFKNPISTATMTGFKLQTAILAKDGNYYAIDENVDGSIKISTPALLSQSRLTAKDTTFPNGTIQHLDTMLLDFFLPVPLAEGCQVTVKLPKTYSTKTITEITTLNAFGQYLVRTTKDGKLIIIDDRTFTVKACDAYVENQMMATIQIASLMQWNYEGPTDSVSVTISAKDGSKVALIGSGVTFTPTRGLMKVTAVAQNPIVQEDTDVTFTFSPQNSIFIVDNPQMKIELPQDIKMSVAFCQIKELQVNGKSITPTTSPTCSFSQQTITISNFLVADFIPSASSSFSFSVSKFTNPNSVAVIKGFKVTLFTNKVLSATESKDYAIVMYNGLLPWQVSKGIFKDVSVTASSYTAYQQDILYTFAFTPDHKIPQNGFIELTIPAELFIPDMSFTQASCKPIAGTGFTTTQITCQFVNTSVTIVNGEEVKTPKVLRILQAFRMQDGAADVMYKFTLQGLQNPESTEVTGSFGFTSFTSLGDPIDYLTSGITIKMMQNARLQAVQVALGSYINSAKTDYTFTMVSTVIVHKDDMVLITFPKQITLPKDEADLACSSTYADLFQSVRCSYDPKTAANTVRINFDFIPRINFINPLDRFAFTLKNIVNPPTLKSTDSLEVNIVENNYVKLNIMTDGIIVTTNSPAQIQKATVTSSSPNPGRQSDFVIDFYAEHRIEVGGGLLIVYPPQITPVSSDSITVEVQIEGITINQSLIEPQTIPSARAVLISRVIQSTTYMPQPGIPIRVTLKGLRNPYTNIPTDSFSVQTFDTDIVDGALNYFFIDKKSTDMIVKSKCNYPCKDCDEANAGVCTLCYSDSELPFLQLGKCVEECATSRFFNDKTQQCDACDETCLQCSGKATTCTKCGVADYLYLFKGHTSHPDEPANVCMKSCPDGLLEDSSQNLCIPCNENCLTCEKKVDSCTTCDTSGKWPYFFHDNCISQCEPKISVLVDGECVECHSSCKTCTSQPTWCTSCEPYMKFDVLKGTCSEMCEPETQIFVPNIKDPEQAGTCELCNDSCIKCAGSVNTCTLCKEGNVLNFDLTCKPKCFGADGQVALDQTAIDGVCQQCEEPCASCSGTTSTCSSCLDNWLLYQQSQCVQYCPNKWTANADKTRCVFEGLVCPSDFQLNNSGDGCVPKQFDCKSGYIINADKSACIPKPGSPVPFPFIISSVIISLLVLGSYIKDKFTTKVLTNLIALIGSLEILMYLLMVIFAITQSQWAVMLVSLAGLIGLFVSNIIWVVWYRSQILSVDEEFNKWLVFFPNLKRTLPICCLLINFKLCKMLYSGFYGLENTMAKFGKPADYYRIMRTATYFSWIFCYVPIYIADIIIFAKIKWGYTLLVLGIETFIIQTISIVLTWIEFRQGPKLLRPIGEHYAQFKKGKEMRVMAVDEDDYFEGIPDIETKTLIRSRATHEDRETELRRRAFVKILNTVGVNLNAGESQKVSHRSTSALDDLQACITKFDQQNLRYRRAFSMSNISEGSWVAEGSDEDQDKTGVDESREQEPRRRYSYPLSIGKLEQIPDRLLFERQVDEIKAANEDFLQDNVYTEVQTHPKPKPRIKIKTVSRRTQTFLRELLQVEVEEIHESDMEVLMEEDAEIQPDFAKRLISNVIDGMSDHSEEATEQNEEVKPSLSVKKRTFKAKKEIPDFDLADIMGEFEIDDLGNYIIMRGENGELLDKMDRMVNRRGYLIDRFGNVINKIGDVIFKVVELDVDDEIPAPFGFEKRKNNMLKLGEETRYTVQDIPQMPAQLDESLEMMDEDNLDNELRNIREKSQLIENGEIKAEVRQGVLNNEELEQSGSAEEGINDADSVGMPATKKKKKRSKKLKKKSSNQKYNNMPPKRITTADVGNIFPTIGVEHGEQRRLARIAGAIGDLASQLARDQRAFAYDMAKTQEARNYINDGQGSDGMHQEFLLDQTDLNLQIEQAKSMLLDRPGAVSDHSLLNSTSFARKNASMERPSTSVNPVTRPKSKQNLRGSNLQRVYGNIVDLVGLEEQHQLEYSRGKSPRDVIRNRVSSGKPVRGGTLENIYLQSQKLNKSSAKVAEPFRPTLNKFADDPAELNIDTQMNAERYGKDISLLMAGNLDKIQRDYLSGGLANVHSHQTTLHAQSRPEMSSTINQIQPRLQTGQVRMDMNNSRMIVGAQSQKNSNLNTVIRGNWLDHDNNV